MSPFRLDISMAEVISLYQSGLSIKAIAEKLQTGKATVFRRLKEANIETRSAIRSDVSSDEIVQLYEMGLSPKHIAEQLHLGKDSIYQRLHNAGIKLRPGPGTVFLHGTAVLTITNSKNEIFFCLVDVADYHRHKIGEYTWHVRKQRGLYYAETSDSGRQIKMHQLITGKTISIIETATV